MGAQGLLIGASVFVALLRFVLCGREVKEMLSRAAHGISGVGAKYE
jgi:hypothetical protein